MKRLCVFCGSSAGVRPEYTAVAAATGRLLVERGIGLVYGGGKVGLMGVLADAVLAASGEAIGVIPHALQEREVGHTGLSEMHVVDTMHQRKALMADLADGFVSLPGGFGTYEEFFEVLTWSQLGIHPKPCGVLNVAGFYDALLALADHAVAEGFVRAEHRQLVLVERDPAMLLDRMATFAPPPTVGTWITPGER